jgi:hypothetical protein
MADARTNIVSNKFSPPDQATLYPAKLFVIMSLFEGARGLPTANCPHYGECDDKVAQYLRKRRNLRLSRTLAIPARQTPSPHSKTELTRFTQNH